eukprot:2997131-Amphidinium_carterae.1
MADFLVFSIVKCYVSRLPDCACMCGMLLTLADSNSSNAREDGEDYALHSLGEKRYVCCSVELRGAVSALTSKRPLRLSVQGTSVPKHIQSKTSVESCKTEVHTQSIQAVAVTEPSEGFRGLVSK